MTFRRAARRTSQSPTQLPGALRSQKRPRHQGRRRWPQRSGLGLPSAGNAWDGEKRRVLERRRLTIGEQPIEERPSPAVSQLLSDTRKVIEKRTSGFIPVVSSFRG